MNQPIKPRLIIARSPAWGFTLRYGWLGIDDSLTIAQPVTMKTLTREERQQSSEPMLLIDTGHDEEVLADLMDQLWQLGIRPKDIGTPGHLAATQAHLADIQLVAQAYGRTTQDLFNFIEKLTLQEFGSLRQSLASLEISSVNASDILESQNLGPNAALCELNAELREQVKSLTDQIDMQARTHEAIREKAQGQSRDHEALRQAYEEALERNRNQERQIADHERQIEAVRNDAKLFQAQRDKNAQETTKANAVAVQLRDLLISIAEHVQFPKPGVDEKSGAYDFTIPYFINLAGAIKGASVNYLGERLVGTEEDHNQELLVAEHNATHNQP